MSNKMKDILEEVLFIALIVITILFAIEFVGLCLFESSFYEYIIGRIL